MVEQVWKDKGVTPGTLNRDVTTMMAERLFSGAQEGFGGTIVGIDYTTPDWNMLASLQRNVWQFAAAKNYQHLRELSAALLDADGNLRTKAQFLAAVVDINDRQMKRYFAAEYELAVAGAQMAGKWVDIERNKDVLPYLQLDAVLDGQTTTLCRSLDGTRLPYDHQFWNMYYPPNHWGCRDTIRQYSSGPLTQEGKIPSADIPPMFRTNLGKQGLVFPPGHSYYEGIPDGVQTMAMSAMRKELYNTGRERLKGKLIPVPGLGDVGFSADSFKEIFNQPHGEYMLKNQLAIISDKLLANAEPFGSAPDVKGKIKQYHYLKVKGLENNFIVVREMLDGRLLMYSIIDAMKGA